MRGKKIQIISVLLVVLTAIGLTACGKEKKKEPETITYSSDDLRIYKAILPNGITYIVDAEGKVQNIYSLDEQGNILAGGSILIPNDKAKEFKYVSAIIPINDPMNIETTLTRQIKSGTLNEYENTPAYYEYKVYVSPADAFKPQVNVVSSDRKIVEIQPAPGEVLNVDGSASYIPTDGMVTVYLKCIEEGEAVITVLTTDQSNISSDFTVKVKVQQPIVQEEDENEDLIETTENTMGWISGTNVRFRERPESTGEVKAFYNSGKELAILGNADGWTKCLIDGEIGYVKSEFATKVKPSETTPSPVPQTVINNNTQQQIRVTPTPAPTAAVAQNDGGDHGYAIGAATESQIGPHVSESHTHYYIKYKTVKPTAKEEGYTIYKCDCGATYKTNYVAATGG